MKPVHKTPPVVVFMAEAQGEFVYVRKWHIVGRAGGGMPELQCQQDKNVVGVGGDSLVHMETDMDIGETD